MKTQSIINGKYTYKLALERAKKFNALPIWSKSPKNARKILKIYIEAQNRNLTSKTKWQVDHIIPLYHPLVCGLHCAENLQILSKQVNEAKSNLFCPYREFPSGKKIYFGERPVFTVRKKKKRKNPTRKNPRKLVKKNRKLLCHKRRKGI